MTTIAYRDGIIASDTGCWIGDAFHPWAKKIAIGDDGTLYGCAGDGSMVSQILESIATTGNIPAIGETKDGEPLATVLCISASGEVVVVTNRGAERHGNPPYFAMGAGAQCAFGALHAGASARQAVDAAIMHANGAGGYVDVIERGGK